MSDPRIILKEELISIGIVGNEASIIALDAGSSQVIVNKEYLDEFKYHKSKSNKALAMITKFYNGELSMDQYSHLLKGDTMNLLPEFQHKFDMVFADPPYFLSNNGLSIQSGKIVSVNKGKWDKSEGFDYVNDFNRKWLTSVRDKMKDDATIWISGTMHNIFSVGQILTELGFKILNVITWEKTNPPPNFSCRFFTYSTEQIIWARKSEKVPHYYNYELMKQLNDDKQMKDVWKLPAIAPWEKTCGKHPTQKPLSVLTRLILASTKPNAWILDPFTGGSTTGIAANLANRRFLGIDQEEEFLNISKNRKLEIENPATAELIRNRIAGFIDKQQFSLIIENEAPTTDIKVALGFCRTKELKTLKTSKTFYFHAIESNNAVKDFPSGILDATRLLIYSGGRSKPINLTGHYSEIKSIELKHKSEIKGKEKSETEFYYEIILEDCFKESDDLKFALNVKKLFDITDNKNSKLLQQFLPALTTWDRVIKSIDKTNANASQSYTFASQDGDLVRIKEGINISKKELTELSQEFKTQILQSFSGTTLKLIEWYPTEIVELNNMSAIRIWYKRQLKNQPYVLVEIYRIQNFDRMHSLTISYREKEKFIWKEIISETKKSYRITNIN